MVQFKKGCSWNSSSRGRLLNPDLKALREQAKRVSGGGDCKCKGPGVISRVCEKACGL